MVAVLEDAVRCHLRFLNGTRRRARRIFRETDEWFAADDPQEPFSFVSICWTISSTYPPTLNATGTFSRASMCAEYRGPRTLSRGLAISAFTGRGGFSNVR